MRIHFISDLHCDFQSYDRKFPECDVVFIAGDVGEDPIYLQKICDANPDLRVIFTPGNHDFYEDSFEQRIQLFRLGEHVSPNLTFLYNDWIEIDGIAIFGATLWSGLDAYPAYFPMMASWYPHGINDVNYIFDWSTLKMINEHRITMEKLKEFADIFADKKKVVMTHFAPSLGSVHAKYADDVPFNAYWCNNIPDAIISQFDLWIHGHVHNNMDYFVGSYATEKECRVVCNPRGYRNENLLFDPMKVIEV